MEIQPVVVGTAGHIDHGKSSLVRALTGTDPDRLAEERRRGMTIDLGFANFPLADGRRVGIVDVPGHERFLRNMVAGAAGIDLVVLVVAADDGVMPQTREHLAILELLGVRRGLVALTKVDMVEPGLAELAREDVKELVQGSFLEQAPIYPLSSITGEGLEEFRAALSELALATEPKRADGLFRMSVQRVFSKEGFGTVVTGIPSAGTAGRGDVFEVLPGGHRARVRGIHAYGGEVEQARAGHSSALNVSGIDRDQVSRGAVIATPGFFRSVAMVAVRLRLLDDLARPVRDRTRVRLHTGTADPAGTLVLLESERLSAGEEGLAQVRLDEPVIAAPGDTYVLRSLSPEVTLGGGVILEESRHRLKRGKQFVLEELAGQEESLSKPEALVLSIVRRRHSEPMTRAELCTEIKRPESELLPLLEKLLKDGRLVRESGGDRILARTGLELASERLRGAVSQFFEENENRVQAPRLELQRASGLSLESFQFALGHAVARGEIEALAGGELRPRGREEQSDPETDRVAELLEAGGAKPPSPAELASELGDEKTARAQLDRLVDLGRAVRASHGLYFATTVFEAAKQEVIDNFARNDGKLEIPQLREALGTSRKFLIPLLEHMDAIGFTMRAGAHRVLRKR